MKVRYALALVLFVFFIVGCGGGGSGTTGASSSLGSAADNSGNNASSYTAKITVQFPPETTGPKALVATTTGGAAALTATHARLVVRRTVTGNQVRTETRRVCDEEGCSNFTGPVTYHHVTYDANKYIVDGALPGPVSITMPPGTAYTLEVLTYKSNSDGTNSMVKYAKTNAFDIAAGETKNIVLPTGALSFIAVDITPPAAVVSGYDYTVAVDLNTYVVPAIAGTYSITLAPTATQYETLPAVTTPTSTPLRSTGNLLQETSNVVVTPSFTPVTVTGVAGATPGMVDFTFTPPAVATNAPTGSSWQLGFTGAFYISDNLLKSDELARWAKWVCNPAPTGDISTLTPQGGVSITF